MISTATRTPAAVTSLPRVPQQIPPEGYEPRRPLSIDRGRSPAPNTERAAVAVGRAMLGVNSSSTAPRNSSREQRARPVPVPEPVPTMESRSGHRLQQRGPPLAPTHPQPSPMHHDLSGPEGSTAILDYANASADSLTALLHKPRAQQSGPSYGNAASVLLDKPRRGRSDPPQGRSSRGIGAAPKPTDYDDEARKLWARLNLDPTKDNNTGFNSLDPLWRHPETGGTFYVGNEVAAKSLNMLGRHGITHVVNCTDSIPLYHERHPGAPITYFRFDITSHYHRVRNDKEAVAFAQPMLNFVGDALSQGKNVMAHCLAGAHRAGTTGVMCLMHFAKLNQRDATFLAKQCRPIIDPICDFPVLLARLERGWQLC